MQAEVDREFVARIDETRAAGDKVCLLEQGAATPTFHSLTGMLLAVMEGTRIQCQVGTCQEEATHICGATADSVAVCDEHATAHRDCIDCYHFDDLFVTLRSASLAQLGPDAALIRRAVFLRDGQRYQVAASSMSSHNRADWRFTLRHLSAPMEELKVSFDELESDYAPDSTPDVTRRFFAVAKSWYLVERHQEDVHLRALYRPAGKITAKENKDADALRDEIMDGTFDVLIQMMIGKEFRWLPHLDTLDPTTRQQDHAKPAEEAAAVGGAEARDDDDAQQAPRMPRRRPMHNFFPVTMGAAALGPMRWDNPYHLASGISMFREGAGIGIGQLFVGLPRRASVFGLHAEAVSADFINVLRTGSDSVRWKFIPINFQNNMRLFRLVSDVDLRLAEYCFKGLLLSDETLRHYGITGATEVVQEPGSAISSHDYHFGIGMQKIAEAHQWHSKPWFMLRTQTHAEFPATPMAKRGMTDFFQPNVVVHGEPASEDVADVEEPPVKKLKGGKNRKRCGSARASRASDAAAADEEDAD